MTTFSKSCKFCQVMITWNNEKREFQNADGSRHDCRNPSTPAQPSTSTSQAPIQQNPVRMTLLEFDIHIQNIAKQITKSLSELAPYTSMTVTFAKKGAVA